MMLIPKRNSPRTYVRRDGTRTAKHPPDFAEFITPVVTTSNWASTPLRCCAASSSSSRQQLIRAAWLVGVDRHQSISSASHLSKDHRCSRTTWQPRPINSLTPPPSRGLEVKKRAVASWLWYGVIINNNNYSTAKKKANNLWFTTLLHTKNG